MSNHTSTPSGGWVPEFPPPTERSRRRRLVPGSGRPARQFRPGQIACSLARALHFTLPLAPMLHCVMCIRGVMSTA